MDAEQHINYKYIPVIKDLINVFREHELTYAEAIQVTHELERVIKHSTFKNKIC